MDSLLHVALATSLIVALAASVRPVVCRLHLGDSILEEGVISAGAALAILSWIASVACLLGLFRPAFAWGVWGVSLLAAARRWRELKTGGSRAWTAIRLKWSEADAWARSLVILCALLAMVALVMALAPPDSSDAGQYHLGLAKLYSVVGGYEHHPTWLRSGFSLNATMLYGFEILLHPRDSVAMSWALWALEGLALIAYGNRWFGRGAGYWTVPFWMAVAVTYSPASGYAEGFLTFQWILAVHTFGLWLVSGNKCGLLLSALFIGTAAGTKPAGLAALGLWLALLPLASRVWPKVRPAPASAGRSLAAAAAVALIVASPWYVRNWVFEHNPVFPSLASVFGSARLNEVGNMPWELWKGIERSFLGFILAPVKAACDPPGWQGNTTAWMEWTYGPWAVACLPAFIILQRHGRVLWFLILWSLAQVYLWYLPSGGHGRHLYPFIQTVAPAAGAVVVYLRARSPRLLAVASVPALIAALPVWGFTLAKGAVYAPVVLGMESRESFLMERMPDAYPVISYINRSLRPPQRVLLVDAGIAGSLLDVPWIYGFPGYMQVNFDPRDWNTSDDFFRKMRASGITHIWMRPDIFGEGPHDTKAAYQRFLDCCAEKLFETKAIGLFRVNFPAGGGG
ncbi:MAG: hypothetical protein HYT87_07605 [Nitrospirae bacterium]|nr:hypothetical protein [Nitrospirota bacterium]